MLRTYFVAGDPNYVRSTWWPGWPQLSHPALRTKWFYVSSDVSLDQQNHLLLHLRSFIASSQSWKYLEISYRSKKKIIIWIIEYRIISDKLLIQFWLLYHLLKALLGLSVLICRRYSKSVCFYIEKSLHLIFVL